MDLVVRKLYAYGTHRAAHWAAHWEYVYSTHYQTIKTMYVAFNYKPQMPAISFH